MCAQALGLAQHGAMQHNALLQLQLGARPPFGLPMQLPPPLGCAFALPHPSAPQPSQLAQLAARAHAASEFALQAAGRPLPPPKPFKPRAALAIGAAGAASRAHPAGLSPTEHGAAATAGLSFELPLLLDAHAVVEPSSESEIEDLD